MKKSGISTSSYSDRSMERSNVGNASSPSRMRISQISEKLETIGYSQDAYVQVKLILKRKSIPGRRAAKAREL
jgi:hypothetical protein